LPTLLINFSEPKWDWVTFIYEDKFISNDNFHPSCEMIQFKSKGDPLFERINNHFHFENPLDLRFEGGHRPPKFLGLKEIELTRALLAKHYQLKFGNSEVLELLKEFLGSSKLANL
jgi:hypothetical protein